MDREQEMREERRDEWEKAREMSLEDTTRMFPAISPSKTDNPYDTQPCLWYDGLELPWDEDSFALTKFLLAKRDEERYRAEDKTRAAKNRTQTAWLIAWIVLIFCVAFWVNY